MYYVYFYIVLIFTAECKQLFNLNLQNAGHIGSDDNFNQYQMRVESGMYFGEVELIQSTQRMSFAESLSSCLVLSLDKNHFMKYFFLNHESLSEFKIKSLNEEVPLIFMLRHMKAYFSFKEFLISELSSEGILFWHAVDTFEHICQKEIDTKYPDILEYNKLTSFAIEYESDNFLHKRNEFRLNKFKSTAEYDTSDSKNILKVCMESGEQIMTQYIYDNATEQVF